MSLHAKILSSIPILGGRGTVVRANARFEGCITYLIGAVRYHPDKPFEVYLVRRGTNRRLADLDDAAYLPALEQALAEYTPETSPDAP